MRIYRLPYDVACSDRKARSHGVRVHHWLNSSSSPFDGNPGLADAVRAFNRDFNRLRPRLERLIPMWCHEKRDSRVSVLEGWCGEEGILLLVRNLRYDVGLDPATGRRVRPFSAKRVPLCRFSIPVPPWFGPCGAKDALSGDAVEMSASDGACSFKIEDLDVWRLVWMPNGKKSGVSAMDGR